jgi:hypothetical protein
MAAEKAGPIISQRLFLLLTIKPKHNDEFYFKRGYAKFRKAAQKLALRTAKHLSQLDQPNHLQAELTAWRPLHIRLSIILNNKYENQ